jgi:hypothetical protein
VYSFSDLVPLRDTYRSRSCLTRSAHGSLPAVEMIGCTESRLIMTEACKCIAFHHVQQDLMDALSASNRGNSRIEYYEDSSIACIGSSKSGRHRTATSPWSVIGYQSQKLFISFRAMIQKDPFSKAFGPAED